MGPRGGLGVTEKIDLSYQRWELNLNPWAVQPVTAAMRSIYIGVRRRK
jgi:hypothetical protein